MNLAVRLLLWAFVLVALAAGYGAVCAAEWVVAPGRPVEVCEASLRTEPRLGPNGVWYHTPPPKCQQVRTGKAPLYHRDGQQMIPAQQSVPEGAPCLRTITLDKFVYGQTKEGGSLWALCRPAGM